MEKVQLNWIANFIWGIADDVLRDLYVRGKYVARALQPFGEALGEVPSARADVGDDRILREGERLDHPIRELPLVTGR